MVSSLIALKEGGAHLSLHQTPWGFLPSFSSAFASNHQLSFQLIVGIIVVDRTTLLPRDNLIWLDRNQSVNSLKI